MANAEKAILFGLFQESVEGNPGQSRNGNIVGTPTFPTGGAAGATRAMAEQTGLNQSSSVLSPSYELLKTTQYNFLQGTTIPHRLEHAGIRDRTGMLRHANRFTFDIEPLGNQELYDRYVSPEYQKLLRAATEYLLHDSEDGIVTGFWLGLVLQEAIKGTHPTIHIAHSWEEVSASEFPNRGKDSFRAERERELIRSPYVDGIISPTYAQDELLHRVYREDLAARVNQGLPPLETRVFRLGVSDEFHSQHTKPSIRNHHHNEFLKTHPTEDTLNIAVLGGRYEPNKGELEFLRGVVKALKLRPNLSISVSFYAAGKKGQEWYLQEFLSLYSSLPEHIQEKILIHRGKSGKPEGEHARIGHSLADGVAVPSGTESFSLVAAEGMAIGNPVLFNRKASSLVEVVGSDNGYSFDRDDPGSIAEALMNFVDNKDLREEKIARSRAQAQLYSWQRFMGELNKFFGELRELKQTGVHPYAIQTPQTKGTNV